MELAHARFLQKFSQDSIAIKGLQLEKEVQYATAYQLCLAGRCSALEAVLPEFKSTRAAQLIVTWNVDRPIVANLIQRAPGESFISVFLILT